MRNFKHPDQPYFKELAVLEMIRDLVRLCASGDVTKETRNVVAAYVEDVKSPKTGRTLMEECEHVKDVSLDIDMLFYPPEGSIDVFLDWLDHEITLTKQWYSDTFQYGGSNDNDV